MAGRVTIHDRLEAAGGRPSGFDYLRVILATGVVFFHSVNLTLYPYASFYSLPNLLLPFEPMILPMFFALSGFLVAGSLARSRTLVSFLGLRAIRILPALLVETVLCAVVLGLVFTTLPVGDYLKSPVFAHYFLNIIGDIHFYLPGVFAANPFHYVNLQLWTVPWEMRCYLAIGVLVAVGLGKRKGLVFGVALLVTVGIFVHHALHHGFGKYNFDTPGVVLVQSFLYGVCIYLFRHRLAWNFWVMAVCLAAFLLLTSPMFGAWGAYLAALPGSYVTVYLGLLQPRRSAIVSSGDYSYGIYLYGFPVQQALVALFGRPLMPWYLNFCIAFLIVVLLAVVSWHLFEKHANKLRPALFGFEIWAIGLWARTGSAALNLAKPAAKDE